MILLHRGPRGGNMVKMLILHHFIGLLVISLKIVRKMTKTAVWEIVNPILYVLESQKKVL